MSKRNKPGSILQYCSTEKKQKNDKQNVIAVMPIFSNLDKMTHIISETPQQKQDHPPQKPNDFFYKKDGQFYGYETELFGFQPPIPCRNVIVNSRTGQLVENKDGQY